ncbi:helix-turn-helix transcriptional regulator [Isoptericola haloaureus]|uniref:LuxR C-terminal-related transcriptional regulator n=1 Tax=Isoptericola haloaureus TaxID=1542902 RepID=A0ABU7Z6Z7_9MICO
MGDLSGVPRLPPWLAARPRLLSRLDDGAPLTVLRGAGGSGKTTLLAQWVTAHDDGDEAVVWITLDAQIRSRAGFWVHVLSRLHRAGLVDDGTFYRELVTVADAAASVRDAIARSLSSAPPVLLVLDDFASAGDFWDDVGLDLLAVLQGVRTARCAVAGRFPTVLEGPAARRTLGAVVLADDDLALTVDEARAVVASSDVRLDDSAVDVLLRSTARRSVLELRYALDVLAGLPASASRTPGRPLTAAQAAEALAAGVRQDLSARVRDPHLLELLGAVSLAPYADAALAQRLERVVAAPADPETAVDPLATLGRLGLGYWATQPDGTPVLRLSDQVRAVAAARFAETNPTLVPRVLDTAAHWLWEQRHDAATAVEYALRAGDLGFADHLLVRVFPLPPQESARLARMLLAMPAAQVRSQPFLAMFLALVLNARPGTQRRATEFLAAAVQASHQRIASAPPAERVVLYGLETAAWRLLGQRTRMLDTARRAVRELALAREDDDLDGAPSIDGAAALAVSQAATSLFFGDDLPAAREAYDALTALSAERDWPHLANVAACGRAMADVLDGRFVAARAELAVVQPDAWPTGWVDGYQGAFRSIAQAWVHIDDGDAEAALAELEPLAPHLDTLEHWEFAVAAGAVAQALQGHASEAERRLGQVRRERVRPTTLPSVVGRLGAMRTILRLATGAAREESRQRLRGRGQAADSALRSIIAAARGQEEDAVALLAQAQGAIGTPLQDALVAVAGVTVAQRTDAAVSATAFGTTLAALMDQHGIHWPVTLLAEEDRAGVLAALEQDGAQDAATTLALAFARVPAVVDGRLWQRAQAPALTPREREVLHALAGTDSRTEIAAELVVSVNTVKAQLRTLYAKLGARTRAEALTRAVDLGLLEDVDA